MDETRDGPASFMELTVFLWGLILKDSDLLSVVTSITRKNPMCNEHTA